MKNYSNWSFIPTEIRYNANLSGKAILLFGEIAALSHQVGYCFASNAYFAELFSVTQRTIRNWLGQLKKEGLVNTEVSRNHKGTMRHIYLAESLQESLKGRRQAISSLSGEIKDTRRANSYKGGGNKQTLPLEKSCQRTTTLTSTSFKNKKNYTKKGKKQAARGKQSGTSIASKFRKAKKNRKGDVARFYESR